MKQDFAAALVPALVSLFGRWNWWLPSPLARLLRVEPSPVTFRAPSQNPNELQETR